MSLEDNNIFKREIFQKVSIKIFDRFQFTLSDEKLINRLQDSIMKYFSSQQKEYRFKFEDLLLQEEYEDSFNEFNDVLKESRENSFEEIFEIVLPDTNVDVDFKKTLKKIYSNNSLQYFLKKLNFHFIKLFKNMLQSQKSLTDQQIFKDNLTKIQQEIENKYNLELMQTCLQEKYDSQLKQNKNLLNSNSQKSFNESSNKSLFQQDSQLRVFLMNVQEQIQQLNNKKFLQQKQKLQNTFQNFITNFQNNQKNIEEYQQNEKNNQFNGFLPFENVYKLQKNDNQTKRQSQVFTIEQVHYDQTDDAEDHQSSDCQDSLRSHDQNKFQNQSIISELVNFCKNIKFDQMNQENTQQNILRLIQKIQIDNNFCNKINSFIKNQIDNIQINQSKKFLFLKNRINKVLDNLSYYLKYTKLNAVKNIKSVTNLSQDINTKYEKLEEENKSLRMVLKTYEDIQLIDKEEDDSFDIKEDKENQQNYFRSDYQGYDEGELEAVQEENSNYESYDSRSNVVLNLNKKKKKFRIQNTFEYINEKQIDLFKDHSQSQKKQVYSTQKSQRSIFDHENILNQLDFEHKRYSKRSISLPRLASKKTKSSVKKLTAKARLFKLNVRLEKLLTQMKRSCKQEIKLKLGINRLINTIKLGYNNNKQFADYISEEPYFGDDNAFQNNLEIQMEYTNDHSVRYQNRKSTTKVNTRDSLRANNQRFSTQPSGTFFQLEEQNKSLQTHIKELKEFINLEQLKAKEILENLNGVLQNQLDYDETLPIDIVDSLGMIIDRIEQLKQYAAQKYQNDSQMKIQNQNILIVLQEQISTCENQQMASIKNIKSLYKCINSEKEAEIIENQYNISNAVLAQIKKISDNFQKLISEQKNQSIQQKDLKIENLYEGEDQRESQDNSYDSDEIDRLEQNLNTRKYNKTSNQSQPSMLDDEDDKSEREKPIREDHEVYQKNFIQKKTTSNMGTSKISSDYEVYDMNREQLLNNLEDNLNQNMNILNELSKERNVDIIMDLTQRIIQELRFGEDFSQTKAPPQRQFSINDQKQSQQIVQLENEVFQKELNFIRQKSVFEIKARNFRTNYRKLKVQQLIK